MRTAISAIFLFLAAVLPSQGMAEMTLLMAEEKGCMWCARWNKELGDIYPKTPEGQAAPLMRVDIHTPLPDNVRLDRALYFTPTFVLLEDGREIGRIEGYPGEDFFWGLLGMLLKDAGALPEVSG